MTSTRHRRSEPHVRADLVQECQPDERAGDDVRGVQHDAARQQRAASAGCASTASGRSVAVAPERDRRERHERRNEEDEPALVADVVQDQLERAEAEPQSSSRSPADGARQRASSRAPPSRQPPARTTCA